MCLCAHTSEGHGHCSPGWSTALLKSCTRWARHSNDVFKSIFRFPWESGSFRGGQSGVISSANRSPLSRLEQSGQRLGPCAVLCFSREHRPCERTSAGSAGLTTGPGGAGQQDRRGSRGRQQPGVGKALEPPDTTRSPLPSSAERSSGGHAGTFQQLNSKCDPAQSLSNWGFCLGSTGPPFPGGAAELASCPGAGPLLV